MAADPDACLFCRIARGEAPGHVVLAEERVAAFLDVRPLFPGHVLVVPRLHVVTLPELPPGEVEPLFAAVRRLSEAVVRALGADGSFVGINNLVSQSVPHLHVHVVPRRKGDGLRGFFWPRAQYASAEEMAETADRIRQSLAG